MPSINYRFEDLRALVALQATGSFVRAAARLHITQPAFSRRIAQLEQAVGGPLVERTSRRVSMTTLGLELVRKSGALLDQLDDAVAEAGRCALGESGGLSVACLATLAYGMLPPVLSIFRQRYPAVRLHLHDDGGQRVVQAVQSRDAEFGVGALGGLPSDLVAEECTIEPYVVVFKAGHPLERMEHVPWEALLHHRIIGLRASSSNLHQINEDLAQAGITLPWFDEVEHLSTLLALLRGGAGAGVLPQFAVHPGGGDALLTRRLQAPAVTRSIGLIRRQDAVFAQPAQDLWRLIASQLRACPTVPW